MLATRLGSCTDVQFDAGVAAWCSEMERTKDFAHFAQLVSRPSVQTSTNNKLAQLVGAVVAQVEANSVEATRAFYSLLSQQPLPTKLLSKHHPRLLAHFEARMDSHLDGLGARCFALLPGMLHKPDWAKAFDSLAAMLQSCLARKNLTGFQNAIVGLVEFMSQPRQVPITPGKLVVTCRRAVDVNADFAKSALCLVEELSRRLGRVGLPWAGTLCEAVDACFEEPLARPNAYHALRSLQEAFGLVVGCKFAPLLATTVRADWSSASLGESTTTASVACVAAFYQTGAASVLPAALRGEFDLAVLDATTAATGTASAQSVELRAAFLDLLLLACTCPTIEGDSTVLRPAVSLFQRVVCSAREDSRLVKPSARRALAMCAFRATSCLPPVRQFVVADVAPQFATSAFSATALTSFSEARFVVAAAAPEEAVAQYQPVTQEETEEDKEEEEEEEEEEEPSSSNKRVQLMPQQPSSTHQGDDSDSDDGDDDDIPDIV